MPDPNTIPFREADTNGHYKSKQLPNDKGEFLEALGLPAFAGDVISASPTSVDGQVAAYWGTDGHTIKASSLTGLAKLSTGVLSSVAAPIGAVVGTTDVQTLTNKTIDNSAFTGTVSGLDKYDVGLGNVDNTSDINKPLSNADAAALALKENKAEKGITNGYAALDTIGKVPLSQLPDAIIGASRYQGTWNAATNSPPIPAAAPANNGYYYSVAVGGSTSIDGISTWIVGDTIISNGSIWQKIPVSNLVQSVNSKTGVVVINKNDVGLGNVDNTSDASKNAAAVVLTNHTIDGASNTLNVRLNTTDVVGNLPVTKLDSGTGATSSTFWRGDGHWVSPTGAGDVQGPGSSTDGGVVLYNGTSGKQLKVFAGASGFGKLDANGVVSTQAQMQAPDIAPAMITGQTEKTASADPDDKFLEVDNATGQLRYVRAKYLAGAQTGMVIGDSVQGTHPASAVILPSFKTHADAIFTGTPSALDDHFDGAVLDAKWNVTTTATNPTTEVSGSKLHLGGVSANATDGIGYFSQANAALPNTNDFTVSAKMDFVGLGKNNNSATAYGDFKIYNTTNNIGLALRLGANAAATGGGYGQLVALGGANNATPVYILPGLAGIPKYLQLVWTLSTKNTILKFSLDGICWQQWAGISGATSGFTAAILPQRLYFMVTLINGSMALLDVDWVKFTNP